MSCNTQADQQEDPSYKIKLHDLWWVVYVKKPVWWTFWRRSVWVPVVDCLNDPLQLSLDMAKLVMASCIAKERQERAKQTVLHGRHPVVKD